MKIVRQEKFSFPQELEDIIFLYLDDSTIKKTREIQSAYVKKCTEFSSLKVAVQKGNLHCVRYLLPQGHKPSKYLSFFPFNLMDLAAENGHLEVVKWFHENRTEGCSDFAMNLAAANGHLEVIKWLHENRTEGASVYAMCWAAQYGHLELVKWLHKNRTEGCTRWAMDHAAQNGHLDIVIWLHENRT